MKRVVTITLAAAIALPLLAEEPKKESKAAQQTQAVTTQTAEPVLAGDSPLVAAAKRANRKGKKPANVITNDSVSRSTKGMTTTTVQRSVDVPVVKSPYSEAATQQRHLEAEEARKAQAVIDAAKKKAAEDAEARRRAAAEMAEEGLYEHEDLDPAGAEHNADQGGQPQQKPPQG